MIVHTELRDLDTPTGPMRTHVYAPSPVGAKRYPGLLLYPEIYQQTGPIVQFAGHGYVVKAPEIRCGETLARAREIRGELLMIWGRQDPHILDAALTSIYKALLDAGLLFGWHEFNALHAFMRDEGARYDPEAARIGVGLALALFQRTL